MGVVVIVAGDMGVSVALAIAGHGNDYRYGDGDVNGHERGRTAHRFRAPTSPCHRSRLNL